MRKVSENLELGSLEIILFAIMVCLGFTAVFLTKKKPSSAKTDKPAEQMDNITAQTILAKWTVYSMDIDGNCINSAIIPESDSETSYIIGTSPDSDFRILNEHVSRKHLIICHTKHTFFLQDNNSSYSTFCKGKKIDDAVIEDKMVVWLGNAPIVFMAPYHQYDENLLCKLIKEDIEAFGIPELGI